MKILLALLEQKKYSILKEVLAVTNPADIAGLMEEISPNQIFIIFRLLSKELAKETFVFLENDKQEMLIKAFSDNELKEVLTDLFVDDIIDIIEEMPGEMVDRILANTDAEKRKLINQILQYPEDSAGSIMTVEFVRLSMDMNVENALNSIREQGTNSETVYTCYVTDNNRKLLGTVSVKSLLLSDYEEKICNIMSDQVICVNTTDDREAAVKKMTKYDLMAIPVVDSENTLVGIITFDDAMDVMTEETEEDFALMAGMTPVEDSYLKTPVLIHAKNRILWLLILMISATVTGVLTQRYEAAFTALPLLIAFLPTIMSTGGNCGSQSSTVIIRALSLDQLKFRDVFKAAFKEWSIGMIVGLALGIVNFIRVIIMYHNNNSVDSIRLAVAVSLAIILTVIVSNLIGCLLPMAAKKLKADPAIMAAPLITTLVDAFSVIIFFNICVFILFR